MATFTSVLNDVGSRTEIKLLLWEYVNATTFRLRTTDDYTLTLSGTSNQDGIFSGTATLANDTDTPVAQIDTATEPQYAGLLRWVHSNARNSTRTIDQIIKDFADEQL